MEAEATPVSELHHALDFLLRDGYLAAVAGATGAVRSPRLDRSCVREDAVPELVADAARGQVRPRFRAGRVDGRLLDDDLVIRAG